MRFILIIIWMASAFNSDAALYYNGSSYSTKLSGVLTYPLTIACWFRADNVDGNYGIVCVGNEAGNKGLWLWLGGSYAGDPLKASSYSSGSSGESTTAESVTAGTWNSAVGLYISANQRAISLNGGPIVTNTTGITITGADTLIVGAFVNGGAIANKFPGSIQRVAVWDVLLSETEIRQFYLGRDPRMIRPDHLVNFLPLEGRNSPEIDLISGGTMTNSGTVIRSLGTGNLQR